MKRLATLHRLGFALLLVSRVLASGDEGTVGSQRPNVLFLAVDDLRAWGGCLEGVPGRVHTPNIDRLAARGVLFSDAHCPSPKCAPSRAAILTGFMPSSTGLYDNGHWWYPNLPGVETLPQRYRRAGYRVVGGGKIFHHTAGNHPPNQWDDFQPIRFRDDPWFRGSELNYPWTEPEPFPPGFPFSGVPGLPHENDWGVPPREETQWDDHRTADYVIEFLRNAGEKRPFFLACGLFRPHLPWYVPQRFLDLYPLETVQLPPVLDGDLADVPPQGQAFARARESDLKTIRAAGRLKEALRAYLASISYADFQIGRVLDALDRSGHAENTIVVFWSDHGWHHGEKGHWHKSTLWQVATHVPLIITAPGIEPGRCRTPVSLIDLYPTLLELCGLAMETQRDGQSLRPLLQAPQKPVDRAAVIEFRKGNAGVVTQRYRFIHYADGGRELYDRPDDPHEWQNLAGGPDTEGVMRLLSRFLPDRWAESKPTKRAFEFDPERFEWTNRETGQVFRGREFRSRE